MKHDLNEPSAASLPRIPAETAERRRYLSRDALDRMHLSPVDGPVAWFSGRNGERVLCYDPARVRETPPELWYHAPAAEAPPAPSDSIPPETLTLENGAVIVRMTTKSAAAAGFYTAERLDQMRYDVASEPVAYTIRRDGSVAFFFDRRTSRRRPQLCVVCGREVRYKRKMCRACFERDLAARRAAGDAYRASEFRMDRSRTLFFDLELTGVYDHDEVISVSVVNGNGEILMDTFVRPLRKKKWTRTQKIHGISPDMVRDAPTLPELTPAIRALFDAADSIIGFGVSTDYSHIRSIYADGAERQKFHRKVHCCSIEFVRYQNEHYPDNEHASLVDAMRCMGIEWDGVPHSSIADTIACMKVWEALFPHYYTTPMPELPDYAAIPSPTASVIAAAAEARLAAEAARREEDGGTPAEEGREAALV